MLIDVKPFFEIPVEHKEEAYEAIIEMTINNDYITANLLDYEYLKNIEKIMQQCFLLLKKKKKPLLPFHKIL